MPHLVVFSMHCQSISALKIAGCVTFLSEAITLIGPDDLLHALLRDFVRLHGFFYTKCRKGFPVDMRSARCYSPMLTERTCIFQVDGNGLWVVIGLRYGGVRR